MPETFFRVGMPKWWYRKMDFIWLALLPVFLWQLNSVCFLRAFLFVCNNFHFLRRVSINPEFPFWLPTVPFYTPLDGCQRTLFPLGGSKSSTQRPLCANSSPETADSVLAIWFDQTPLRPCCLWIDFKSLTSTTSATPAR